MPDGATQEEIVKAWSSQGGDARDRRDVDLLNKINAQNPGAEVSGVMPSVATESKVAENAHDSARELGAMAANEMDKQEVARTNKLAQVREAIANIANKIKGPDKPTPQPNPAS